MVLASVRASMPSIIVPVGRNPTTTIVPTNRSSARLLAQNRRCWGNGRNVHGVLTQPPLRPMDGPSVETFEERARRIGKEQGHLHETGRQPTIASVFAGNEATTSGFLRLKMTWTDDGDTAAEDMEDGEPRRELASTTVVVVFTSLPFVVVSPRSPATGGAGTGGSVVALPPSLPPAVIAPQETALRVVVPSAPPLDEGATSTYRALIERYMTVRCSNTTTDGKTTTVHREGGGYPAAVWTCRRCGAERRESRRRSAGGQWLRSHLRACIGVTVDEDYCESAVARADTVPTPPPTTPTTIVLPVPPPEATTPPAKRHDFEAPLGGTPHPALLVQPDWAVDVCLGHGPSPGYRSFQEAVKLVRIPTYLRGGWEDEAVRQALQHLKRRTHPLARILVRDDSCTTVGGGGGGSRWRVADKHEIRRKVLALYRYYFSFQPSTLARSKRPDVDGVAEPWPFLHQLALRQLEEEAEMEGKYDDVYFGENQHRTEAASNLDAGIIRHVLLQNDDDEGSDHWDRKHSSNARSSVVSPNSVEKDSVPPTQTPVNLSPPDTVLQPTEPHRRKSLRSRRSPYSCDDSLCGSTHRATKRPRRATTSTSSAVAADDDGLSLPKAGPHDGDAAPTTPTDASSARWAARARLRRREAGRLEHWVRKVRNARQTVARRTIALERARQRYQALAVGSRNAQGSAVPDQSQERESSEPPQSDDRAIAGCSADQLVGRLQEAHRFCRAQALQLEQRTAWWQHEFVALKALLKSSKKPTPEFLAEDARCKLLMSEAHALLL